MLNSDRSYEKNINKTRIIFGRQKMILVSGLVNIETNLKVKGFPIDYFPIDYPFFGIDAAVSGVGMNIGKALTTLGEKVVVCSLIGNDEEGNRIEMALEKANIGTKYLCRTLKATPQTIVLYDESGKREVYCDLKDIQDQTYDIEQVKEEVSNCNIAVICNINFNRGLLKAVKEKGICIATDVHVLEDIHDAYNKEFMENADILFLSDEKLPKSPEAFLKEIEAEYHNKIIVLGQGSKGVLMYLREEERFYQLPAVDLESLGLRKVVNTVGAGDALFSAFIHYYGKGLEPLEALKRAEVFAAYKIGESGAAKGFIDEMKVEEILKQVTF